MPRGITIAEIIEEVANFYGLTKEEMIGRQQGRRIARPRFIAMAIAKDLTKHSTTVIGQHFGGRDHTTVSNAINRTPHIPGMKDEIQTVKEWMAPRMAEKRQREMIQRTYGDGWPE